MQKEKTRTVVNPIGVDVLGDQHIEGKTQKGITLIALVITIIVMLILVGVSVTVALNGGLFNTAKKAKTDTQGAISAEQKLDDGRVKINGQWYASIQDYIDKNPILMGIELSEPTIALKKSSANKPEEGVLEATITATPFGMDKEPEILWETDPNEQEVIELSATTGKEITVTVKENTTENATIKLIAKCTYEGTTYTEECTVNLEIIESSSWSETTKPDTWVLADGTINSNVKAMTNGMYTIPLPTGYTISNDENEKKVTKGLVIKDSSNNEFVWIPVAAKNFIDSYPARGAGEPKYMLGTDKNTYSPTDSQATLNYYYGTNHYTINPSSADANGIATNTETSNGTTFDYGYHYNEMVTSVNKYGGFYIGRYETTVDNGKIGSKAGASVLSSDMSLTQTNNNPCRWWGLYAVQRNSDVVGNGSIVQTNMIWGQQWNAMIAYFDNVTLDYSINSLATAPTSKKKQNAGQAMYRNGNKIISDKICNIFDLRGNTYDWTTFTYGTDNRGCYGGYYTETSSASSYKARNLCPQQPR